MLTHEHGGDDHAQELPAACARFSEGFATGIFGARGVLERSRVGLSQREADTSPFGLITST